MPSVMQSSTKIGASMTPIFIKAYICRVKLMKLIFQETHNA